MRWLLTMFVILAFFAVDSQIISKKHEPLGGPKPLGKPGIIKSA